ncbi:hypothetical protein [Enterococcus olivae]
MDAIENIILEINRQTEEERDILEKNRLEEIDTHFLVEKRSKENEHQQLLARQKDQLERKFQQEKNRLIVKGRQTRLKEKQKYLERIFEAAYQTMANWDEEQAREFAEQSLEKSGFKDGMFIPGNLMSDTTFTSAWLDKVNEQLQTQFVLGTKSREKEHGFLIEQKGIQYNFFYHELLSEMKKTNGSEIMHALFNEEG